MNELLLTKHNVCTKMKNIKVAKKNNKEYVCMYVCIFAYMHVCIYTHVCIYACMNAYMYVYKCVTRKKIKTFRSSVNAFVI